MLSQTENREKSLAAFDFFNDPSNPIYSSPAEVSDVIQVSVQIQSLSSKHFPQKQLMLKTCQKYIDGECSYFYIEVYKCYDCGYATFCEDCWTPSNHKGHKYSGYLFGERSDDRNIVYDCGNLQKLSP